MTLDTSDLQVLKRAFPRANHEFITGYVYLSEEAISNRIEEVDPAWTFEIQRLSREGDQAICCARMTIKGVSREGVGMYKATGQSGEPEKSAATDAIKRCARLFGLGRYLLDAPKEGQAFDRWLADQQKTSAIKPSTNGHDPDTVSTEQPSAKVTGLPRPIPPSPASTKPTPPADASSNDLLPSWADDADEWQKFLESADKRFGMDADEVDTALTAVPLELADWRASKGWATAAVVAASQLYNPPGIEAYTGRQQPAEKWVEIYDMALKVCAALQTEVTP